MQEQTQTPNVIPSEITIPEDLKSLFYEPPLLEGEDPNLYWGLLGAVIDERKPRTVSDWIAVNDLVTKLWEERVFRRASNALIRGGTLSAVQHFLAEVRGGEDRVKQIAEAAKYFSDISKERNQMRSRLAKYGITPAELHAKAFEQNSEALQILERMISSRERGRRKLRKEDERRRRQETREAENR